MVYMYIELDHEQVHLCLQFRLHPAHKMNPYWHGNDSRINRVIV